MCRRRPVATVAVGVATQLARDRRRRAAQPPGDRTDRLSACAGQRDLLALGERQAAALELAPAARAHAAARRHPARALLAIRTRRTAASAMNSPRCSAAQNGCTTSGTWALTNRAIHSSSTEQPRRTTPAPDESPAIPRAVDRRLGSPYGLASATTDAHPIKRPGRLPSASPRRPRVALTARTQGTPTDTPSA